MMVDQIFDRLETLLKSLWNQDRDPLGGSTAGGARPSGDSDLDDAMDELNAFLKDDRAEQERLERKRRAQDAEREARSRASAGSAGQRSHTGPSARLIADYKTLGLAFGAPLSDVKTAYKRLLKQHHPDRHADNTEAQKKATEQAARLNEAYDHIERWVQKGKTPEEG